MAKQVSQPKVEPKQLKPSALGRALPPGGLKNYQAPPPPPPRNALAQRLAAEYNAKQMLVPTSSLLADEIGARPAPMFSLNKFDPNILSGSRRNYENWRMNARAPKAEFGGVVTPMLPRA